jgi:hypothetical protein
MAAPTFETAGAGAAITGASGTVSLTTSEVVAGDLVMLHVLRVGTGNDPTVGTIANIESLDGTASAMDSLGAFVAAGGGEHGLWFGRIIATNTATSVVVTAVTAGDCYCRLYRFQGVNTGTTLADIIENDATTHATDSATQAQINDVGVVTNGADRLAVNVVAVTDDNALDAFTGQSGGTWAEAVAEFASTAGNPDGCLQLQIAEIAAAGTINGGSFTMGASDGWGVIGFALIPGAVGSETPTPGGAVAQGTGPGAGVPPSQGGGGAGGTGATAATPLTAQGAATGANDPSAIVAVSPGGATAGGNPPTEVSAIIETPTPGGATASGSSPLPVVGVALGGATGQGNPPGTAETAGSGGATAAGNGPTAVVIVAVGGATAQGIPPATAETAGSGGALAAGNAATAVVGVTPGGATAGGRSPQVGDVTETPIFGGATAGGASPAASVTSATGGASANGSSPSPSSTPTPGGATSSGSGPSSASSSTAGGAIAGGLASTPAAAVDLGGSSTGSGSITALVFLSPGGATAGGNAPSAPLTEQPLFGGATAGGISPTPAAAAALGGSVASFGTTNTATTLTAQGAIAGGNAPTEIGVLPPTPTGPMPGSGATKRVRIHRDRIEYLDGEPERRLTEEEEEALLLIALSLE